MSDQDREVEHSEDFVTLKNEAAKWLEDTICQTIPNAPLEDILQNGVVLERLSRILQARYQQWSCQLKEISHEAMLRSSKAGTAASARTAYDVSKFFKFCRDLGVPEAQICEASDVMEPTPGATFRVCVTLYGTWHVCVQRGIDYGEYFHHGNQMKLMSTKTPLKPKKQSKPAKVAPPGASELHPRPNMKPHSRAEAKGGKRAAPAPTKTPPPATNTPPAKTPPAKTPPSGSQRRSPGPQDFPAGSASALPLRHQLLGARPPPASSTMSTYNSSTRSVATLSPSPSAERFGGLGDASDDNAQGRRRMGSPGNPSPPKRKSPYFSKLSSPPIPRFPYNPSYETSKPEPTKSRRIPGLGLLAFVAKVTGVVAVGYIAADQYDKHYAGFQRMQEMRRKQRAALTAAESE